jgi:HD-GYP domain-containing protein (c-di-GMP phosphodiesterase class II)
VGEDIPLFSRVIAVADSYDAMTSNRSHRAAMMPAVAIQRLILNSGTQFDPDVVEVAVELYRHNNKLFDAA